MSKRKLDDDFDSENDIENKQDDLNDEFLSPDILNGKFLKINNK